MRTACAMPGLVALGLTLSLVGPIQAGPAATPPASHDAHHGATGVAIPGLSADEIAALRAGQGMSQARVAEVEGYPGPRHVLDAWTAGDLPLAAEQAARVQEIMQTMTAEARRVGNQVLESERALALAFRSGAIDAPSLRAGVDRIAALRGELRAVHLNAHLETRALLDPEQLARYAELRSRAPAGPPRHED